jgi:hypothetical protein
MDSTDPSKPEYISQAWNSKILREREVDVLFVIFLPARVAAMSGCCQHLQFFILIIPLN